MSVTISGGLISHVRQIYQAALEYLASGIGVRQGINGYTDYALPAYIITVAAVESFVNEAFLNDMIRMTIKDSPMWNIHIDTLENMELRLKLILFPQLLFQKSLSQSFQPYQDMNLLIKIRNEFIHYKMKDNSPKFLQNLEDRRISLVTPAPGKGDYFWVHNLCSSEGIRWAHNTACSVVNKLFSFMPSNSPAAGMISALTGNFSAIPESFARDWLKNKGIDPDSKHP
jgi:hypothetical protein